MSTSARAAAQISRFALLSAAAARLRGRAVEPLGGDRGGSSCQAAANDQPAPVGEQLDALLTNHLLAGANRAHQRPVRHYIGPAVLMKKLPVILEPVGYQPSELAPGHFARNGVQLDDSQGSSIHDDHRQGHLTDHRLQPQPTRPRSRGTHAELLDAPARTGSRPLKTTTPPSTGMRCIATEINRRTASLLTSSSS
jgi:hypothetical protein